METLALWTQLWILGGSGNTGIVDPGRQWKHRGFVDAAVDTGTSLEEMPCECHWCGWDGSLKHQQPYELIAFTQQDAC